MGQWSMHWGLGALSQTVLSASPGHHSPIPCPSTVTADTLHPQQGPRHRHESALDLQISPCLRVYNIRQQIKKQKTSKHIEEKTIEEKTFPSFLNKGLYILFCTRPYKLHSWSWPKALPHSNRSIICSPRYFQQTEIQFQPLSVVSRLTSCALCLPALSVPSTCLAPGQQKTTRFVL